MTAEANTDEEAARETPVQAPVIGAGVKVPLLVIAIIAFLGAMDYAKSLMLPIVLAFVVSLTLAPVNMWLQRRIGAALSALLLVSAIAGALAVGALTLSQPVGEWIADAPRIGAELRQRLYELREPVGGGEPASVGEVEEVSPPATTGSVNVDELVVREAGRVRSRRRHQTIGLRVRRFHRGGRHRPSPTSFATNRLIYERSSTQHPPVGQ